MLSGVEFDEHSAVFDMMGLQLVGPFRLSFIPHAGTENGGIELHHEMDGVLLVGIVAPHVRTCGKLMADSLDPGIGNLADIDVHQFIPVFAGDVQVYHHPSVLVGGEGEFHHGSPFGGSHVGPDSGIGKINAVMPEGSFLRRLVYAGTVSLVRPVLVTDLGLKGTVGGHDSEPGHRPFMDVGEASDALDAGLVSRLPSGVLVVRTQLDHAERHPGAGGDHPAGMRRTHAGINVICQRLQRLRTSFNLSGIKHESVCKNLIF